MILLNPGPVNVSERVRQSLLGADICHREEEFAVLLHDIRRKLLRAFAPNGGYHAVVLTGSGTAAVESAVISCVAPGRSLLVIKNGRYGERMAEIAAAHRLGRVELSFDWTARPDVDRIEATLQEDPSIQVVAVVHHETTTGLLNPLLEIGELVHQYGKELLVDAVSAIGGETVNLAESHVGIVVGTAGKCIQGFPGVSFLLIRHDLMEAMRGYPKRSVYLHAPSYCGDSDRPTVPFTPSVQVHYAFREALTELLDEGVDVRIQRYRFAAAYLRERFQKLDLECLLEEDCRSNTITAVRLPGSLTYETLHADLKAKGFVIYAGQGHLSSDIFRVSNMGNLTLHDFERFGDALEQICHERAAH